MIRDLIIVGGGASGLIAAITAKDLGLDVAILESTDRIGRKILTTGNGRCNITNKNIDISRYHSSNKNFPAQILNEFSVEKTINFFNSIGLPTCTLENGKMFPLSLQSSSVVDILKLSIEERQIPTYFECKVKSIDIKNTQFILHTNNEDQKSFVCKRVLLCTGGKSYVGTGSDGSGYILAKTLGHKIIDPIPSLVQIKLHHNKLKALSGIKFQGSCEISVDDKFYKKTSGEILFTDYGISGPPILQLSRIASFYTNSKHKVSLSIDMFPNLSLDSLKEFLENHWGMFGYRSIHNSFLGILNKKLISTFLKECGITDIHKETYYLQWYEKCAIFNNLKNWTFEVSGTNSFRDAQVTAGGINSAEVDNRTLESKIVPGLYLAGEVLDVDGDCGGFNLQWAWSSGNTAAKSIYLSLQ